MAARAAGPRCVGNLEGRPKQAADSVAARPSNSTYGVTEGRYPRAVADANSSCATPARTIGAPAPAYASSCSARTRAKLKRTAKGASQKIHSLLAKRKSDKYRARVLGAAINATKNALWCCTLPDPPPHPNSPKNILSPRVLNSILGY